MVDRKLLKNPNGLILGTPGSGKSFSAKREIANCFLLTSDDVIICDPEAEYAPLVERLHGQVIKISPTSTNYINPVSYTHLAPKMPEEAWHPLFVEALQKQSHVEYLLDVLLSPDMELSLIHISISQIKISEIKGGTLWHFLQARLIL